MKLLNIEKISEWAYFQCRNGNDSEEIRSLITDPEFAFWYCIDVKDRPEVRKYIDRSYNLKVLKARRKLGLRTTLKEEK